MLRRKAVSIVIIAVPAILLMLSGCSPIKREYRREANRDIPFDAILKAPDAFKGTTFVWGGWIVETANGPGGTELVVLQTPLGASDRPKGRELSQGRFIAKTAKFLDPAIYAQGRAVTVAGEVSARESRAIDDLSYSYPVLEARQIHLWPVEEPSCPRTSFGVGVGVGL